MAVTSFIYDLADGDNSIPFESIGVGVYDLFVQYRYGDTTPANAAFKIELMQSINNNEDWQEPILDSEENEIICELTAGTGNDFLISKSFYGKYGWFKITVLTATVGDIEVFLRWNGNQSVELT